MWERLFRWLIDHLRGNWPTLLLFTLLLSLISLSLDEANWVAEDDVFLIVIQLGLLFGWLLARSRFSGWFSMFYSLFISVVIAVEAVGKILPGLIQLFTTPFGETINQMNLRAFELQLRIMGWLEMLQAGDSIQDTGLFVLLLSFILVLCAVWLVWAVVRQRNAMYGLLPIGLLFAINVHLSQQSLMNYAIFLFCAALLISRMSFNRQQEEWAHRRVDYSDQLGLEWGGIAMALTLVIVLAARTAPLFGTPDGWRAISEWMERYQEQTSETAERFFGGVNPPPPEQDRAVYVNTPNMSEIGAPIPQGYETIMWVKTSDPPPLPPEIAVNVPYVSTRIHYWRNGIYSIYNGRGWEAAAPQEEISAQPEALPEAPPPGRYYLSQTFQIEARHRGSLFSVNDPVQTGEAVYLRGVEPDNSLLLEGQVEEYQVISQATNVTANQLASAPVEYPEEISSVYLQLPEQLPSRVRALTERVVGAAGNPYQKAINIQNYLRLTFPYDLSAQPTPEQRDLVDYFLFDLQKGFCSHYASAMVVMLRAEGVPARVATGYAMGDWDPSRQAFRVASAGSHAWVEVYFPGYGWIEFEPTAYRPPIEYPEEEPLEGEALPPVQIEQPQQLTTQPYYLIFVIGAALLLLALPFLVLRMFTASRQAPAVQVDVLYRQMRRALGLAGLIAVPSVTPDEYLAQYGESLQPYSRLSQALRDTTSLYREMIYSPHPPDERRVRVASKLWQSSVREWLVLWVKTAWKNFRSQSEEMPQDEPSPAPTSTLS